MIKQILFTLLAAGMSASVIMAQDLKDKDVPEVVKSAFAKKYTVTEKVSWEKEKGNFEANWGGKSGEDNSAVFTPTGSFVEIVNAMPVSAVPANIVAYVSSHYNKAHIKEAGKVTDAAGKHMIEVEIKGKDLVFDEAGNFLKEDED